jgi:parvulin-like peptidyl-prolyl isomerase
MKRNTSIAWLALIAAFVSAEAVAQTPIKRGLPAFTVTLTKSEIYSIDEFNANIARLEKTYVSRMNPSLSAADKEKARIELMASVKPRLLDAQLSAMLFRQYCEREGIVVTESDLNAYIARLKAQVGATGTDDASFEQMLALTQESVLDLRTFARQRLALLRYIQAKRADDVKALKGPSSDDILKAYESLSKSGELTVPETARISLVFIDFKGKDADERKKAQETMRGLAAKIKDDKSYFDKLLLGSFDPNAGYMTKSSFTVPNTKGMQGGYDPKFTDAVFSMKTGEISGLLENEQGLQIVRVNERSPQRQLGLYDAVPGQTNVSVQDLIVQQFMIREQESFAAQVQNEILDKVRGEATVNLMKENLKGIIGDAELDAMAARYAKKKK